VKIPSLSSSFLTAVVIGVCAYLILPTLVIVPISFTQADYISFPPEGFSFRWYEVFVGEGVWRSSTITSVIVALLSAALSTVIGTAAALGMKRRMERVRALSSH
jgi:putative spermidine/putrescine transport system permease protein